MAELKKMESEWADEKQKLNEEIEQGKLQCAELQEQIKQKKSAA